MSELTIQKFKSRIRLAVCLLLLAVVAISAWSMVSERADVISAAEHKAEGYARALAEHSESAFAESDRLLRDLIHDIQRDKGIDRIDRQELFRELQRQAGDSPQIGSLFIVDANGTMFINSIEFPSRQINVADREYFRYYATAVGTGLSISRPVLSRLVNRWRFNVMRPLNRPGEPFKGLAAVAFEVEYFKKFFSAASLGPRGRIVLVRNDGAPLVYEPFVENVYQSDFRNTILFRKKLPVSPFGTFHVEKSDLDKSPRIVSYQRLSRFPVVAMISLHRDDVLAPWFRKAVLQSSLTLGLCLSVVLLMQLLIRYLDRLQTTQNSLREQQEIVRIKAEQIDAANDAIMLLDMDGGLIKFNNALCQMTGYERSELQGMRLHDIVSPESAPHIAQNIQILRKSGDATFESDCLTKEAAVLPIEVHARLMESDGRKLILGIARDISERRNREHLEAQLHHVQKIEAVGQLAGGIAHDFNNLLTPIIVYAEMIKNKLPEGDALAEKAEGIVSASFKARDLTRQLLSFGRKQLLSMQSVDLNEIVNAFRDIMRRTIRENISINVRLAPGEIAIWADRGQVEQVLLNLMVNAQDAIEGNGAITIETGHVVLDNEYAGLHPGMQTGPYALLAFKDDGSGMDDDTLSHIFEPFFTTKQIGHGTGLGLATVYGIVKQHDGYITVTSRIGKGTTFSIYLPISTQSPATAMAPADSKAADRATNDNRTILVVEDNDMIRAMAVELLESHGYAVLAADRPSMASELLKGRGNGIDLLVTDVIMPEMNGQELYESLKQVLPGLKVLYISGYTNELFVHNGTLEEGINFLQKPFTTERFLERVRQTLE